MNLRFQLRSQLFHGQDLLGGLLRGPEPALPLLVHFRSRRDSVDGHVQHLPRPDDGKQAIDALEDGHHHLVLRLGRGPREDE